MVHHKHKSLTFLSIFFALPGVLAMALLIGAHLYKVGVLQNALGEASDLGDPTVYFMLLVAGAAYALLLLPAFVILKRLEHEPYARRVRLVLLLLAVYNVLLLVSAGDSTLFPEMAGFAILLFLGLFLDKKFPHYL